MSAHKKAPPHPWSALRARLQQTDSSVLVAIVTREKALVLMAQAELAERGQDQAGKWVGHALAQQALTEARTTFPAVLPDGTVGRVTIPEKET